MEDARCPDFSFYLSLSLIFPLGRSHGGGGKKGGNEEE